MSEIERIRGFLGAVRRRLLVRAAIETAGFGAAAIAVAVVALAMTAAAVGPAGFWPAVTTVALALLALGALTYGLLRPARALREDRAAAHRVGAMIPALASDLLSAVELGEPARAGDTPATLVSPAMIRAFHGEVARTLTPVQPRALVPLGPAAAAVGTFVVIGA